MKQSLYLSWTDSLDFLRNCGSVPAALSNATTLVAARHRWGQHIHCRTSMHDLLFTAPEDEFPFTRSVVVRVDRSRHLVRLTNGDDVAEIECTTAETDRVVDEALEALVAPAQVCRACGSSPPARTSPRCSSGCTMSASTSSLSTATLTVIRRAA